MPLALMLIVLPPKLLVFRSPAIENAALMLIVEFCADRPPEDQLVSWLMLRMWLPKTVTLEKLLVVTVLAIVVVPVLLRLIPVSVLEAVIVSVPLPARVPPLPE